MSTAQGLKLKNDMILGKNNNNNNKKKKKKKRKKNTVLGTVEILIRISGYFLPLENMLGLQSALI